jgi:hypothetical protein
MMHRAVYGTKPSEPSGTPDRTYGLFNAAWPMLYRANGWYYDRCHENHPLVLDMLRCGQALAVHVQLMPGIEGMMRDRSQDLVFPVDSARGGYQGCGTWPADRVEEDWPILGDTRMEKDMIQRRSFTSPAQNFHF